MEFRVLGRVEVHREGKGIVLSGVKQYTVLAALLLARGSVVSDDQLSRLLWGWDPPVTMSAQLYSHVSRLRRLLGDEVTITRLAPGYALDIGDCAFDLLAYEHLAAAGQKVLASGDVERAGALLRDALALWRGPVLANVTDELADTEAPALTEARLATLEQRTAVDLASGRHPELIAELTSLVAEFPLRERLRGQLMTALAGVGRKADALRLYHEGRRLLVDELGVDPGEELHAVYQSVLDDTVAVATAGPHGMPLASGPAPRMLPPDIADFTGRAPELMVVADELAEEPPGGGGAWRPRRAVLLGMPGVGKTALAVRAAHAARDSFPDGQLHARLRTDDGTARTPENVLLTLLRALGHPPRELTGLGLGALVSRYRQALDGRRVLVLLDDAVSDAQVAPLLPNSPESAVIVTARSPLPSVAGARITVLEPLDDLDAYGLLVATAGATRIAASVHGARELLEHCAGLPLAIRVVGTRLACRPHWDPARLAARLADDSRRLDELRFGALDVPARLHSAQHTLPPAAAAALPRLAALAPTGFDPDTAATALLVPRTEAEHLLDTLVDTGLLQLSPGGARYKFHPLVRLSVRRAGVTIDS